MEPSDFLRLLLNSKCLIGNSSVGIRESSFLGIPVVDIGSRQAGRSRGANVLHVAYNQEDILSAIRYQLNHGKYNPENIYGDGKAGVRIADALANQPLTFDKKISY